MSKTFVVIAHARTGSTFICQKLGELADAHIYFELFHNDLQQTYQFLGDLAGPVRERFEPLANGNLRDYLANHPLDLLDFLAARNHPTDQIFKLFPNHITPKNVQAVLAKSAGVMMLHRNLLHSFLSHEIALQTQKWVNDNTSDQKVRFDTKRFGGYVRFITRFYTRVEAILQANNIPYTDICYEDVLTDPNHFEDSLAKALTGVGATLSDTSPASPTLRRQDTRPLASDKVSNPEELLSFLAALNLKAANGGHNAIHTSKFRDALS